MSQQDANDWTPEQAAASGYPDSSPAPGADEHGTPPVPTGAPPAPAQPGPDHPRFNEVYRNWKDTERENTELQERLTRYESIERPMGTPPPPPVQQQPTPTSAQDDPEAWLENTITGALDKRLAPLEQALTAQQQQQQLAQQAAQFRAANPTYNDAADSQRLLGAYRKYGGNVSLDDCYRFAFPERFAQGQPAPQAPAPMADVPNAAPSTPGDSPEELMLKLADPTLTAFQREQIASQLRDAGAWGMGGAEKALGYR